MLLVPEEVRNALESLSNLIFILILGQAFKGF